MSKKKSKKSNQKVICPYCGSKAVLKQGNSLFGSNAVISHIWVCSNYPVCDSYVSAHTYDKSPQGMLANKRLRKKRRKAHSYLDTIWRERIMTRKETYRWLQIALGLPEDKAHVAMLSLEDCNRLITKTSKLIETYLGKDYSVKTRGEYHV